MFEAKNSALYDLHCVVNGLNLYLEQGVEFVIKSMFYMGSKHEHYVESVLVFAASSFAIEFLLNVPSTMLNSIISKYDGISDKLDNLLRRIGARVMVDSVFCKINFSYLIKSSQDCVANSDGTLQDIHRFGKARSAL